MDKAPFRAYPMPGGITFTYGGLTVSADGAVLTNGDMPIPGLFACGGWSMACSSTAIPAAQA